MLGVIIGVMSVTIIVMIQNGFNAYLTTEFRKLGADTLFVIYDPGRRQKGQSTAGIDGLTNEDIKFVLDRAQNIEIGSGTVNVPSSKATFGEQEFDNPKITAVDQNFFELNRFKTTSGRLISKEDVTNRANVCIIGTDLVDRLFHGNSPIGKLVTTGGFALEVVGVIEKTEFFGSSTANMMFVPLTMAQRKWVGGKHIDMMMLRAKSGIKVDDAMEQTWQALMVRSGNRAIYRLDSRESILQVFGKVLGAAGAILASIAALSLLVGGIGIMNIMLVSVTERTKEIGLRKAVGAKSTSIMVQFLVEAGTLSLFGGLIGMGIAWSLGRLVHAVTVVKQWPGPNGFETPFPITAAIFAAIFSAVIGMVFGLFPAMTASKLDPIVALRTE